MSRNWAPRPDEDLPTPFDVAYLALAIGIAAAIYSVILVIAAILHALGWL